jgi:hypothetical protein
MSMVQLVATAVAVYSVGVRKDPRAVWADAEFLGVLDGIYAPAIGKALVASKFAVEAEFDA